MRWLENRKKRLIKGPQNTFEEDTSYSESGRREPSLAIYDEEREGGDRYPRQAHRVVDIGTQKQLAIAPGEILATVTH